MNNSFVSNVNENMTVRGYVTDENELVLLEPEGSSGGVVDAVMVNAVTKDDYALQLDISCEQLIEYHESGKVVMFTAPDDFRGSLPKGVKYGIVLVENDGEEYIALGLAAMQTVTTNFFSETDLEYAALTDPVVLDYGD